VRTGPVAQQIRRGGGGYLRSALRHQTCRPQRKRVSFWDAGGGVRDKPPQGPVSGKNGTEGGTSPGCLEVCSDPEEESATGEGGPSRGNIGGVPNPPPPSPYHNRWPFSAPEPIRQQLRILTEILSTYLAQAQALHTASVVAEKERLGQIVLRFLEKTRKNTEHEYFHAGQALLDSARRFLRQKPIRALPCEDLMGTPMSAWKRRKSNQLYSIRVNQKPFPPAPLLPIHGDGFLARCARQWVVMESPLGELIRYDGFGNREATGEGWVGGDGLGRGQSGSSGMGEDSDQRECRQLLFPKDHYPP
jgi:hypothetical protein